MTLKRRRPQTMLDVGTGTGVLAIALAKRTHLPVVASDIDPIATRTALENARDNGVAQSDRRGHRAGARITRVIAAARPYDLIVANILAGPLAALAPAIGRAARPARDHHPLGPAETQAPRVVTAYARPGHGAAPEARARRLGDADPGEGLSPKQNPRRSSGDSATACMGWSGSVRPLGDRADELELVAAATIWRVASRVRAPRTPSRALRKSGLVWFVVCMIFNLLSLAAFGDRLGR